MIMKRCLPEAVELRVKPVRAGVQEVRIAGVGRGFHFGGEREKGFAAHGAGRSFDGVGLTGDTLDASGFDKLPEGFKLARHMFQKSVEDSGGEFFIAHQVFDERFHVEIAGSIGSV